LRKNMDDFFEAQETDRATSRADRLKKEKGRRRRRNLFLFFLAVVSLAVAVFIAWGIYSGMFARSATQVKEPGKNAAQSAVEPKAEVASESAQASTDDEPRQPATRKLMNLLVIGVEETAGRKSAKGLLLAKVDFQNGSIKAISIPDKVYLNIPGLGLDQISQSYNVGLNSTRKAVEDLLQVPIENHVVLHYGDFEYLINEKRFNVVFDKSVETGFFENEVRAYSREVGKINSANTDIIPLPVKFVSINGEPYYEPNNDEVNRLVFALWGINRVVKSDTVRVIVLNGSGTPGIGREISQRLTSNGFMVTDVKNASNFSYTKTQIVVYKEEYKERAKTIQQILGVGTVATHLISQDVAEIAIIVGKDFKSTN